MQVNRSKNGPTWLMGRPAAKPALSRRKEISMTADAKTTNRPQEAYIVTLRPTGEGPPGPIRLRRFLKCALRSFGLRCIGCEPAAVERKGDK